MQRIQNLIAWLVAATMCGHDLIVRDDLDAIDVAFHRHGLESDRSRHTVIHVVEARKLILVDLRGLPDAGIKAMLRQRSRAAPVVC